MNFQDIVTEYDKDYKRYSEEFSLWMKNNNPATRKIHPYNGFNVYYLKFENMMSQVANEMGFTDKQFGLIHRYIYENYANFRDTIVKMGEMCEFLKKFNEIS